MADDEQKALQLMAEGEKMLNSAKGFFESLFGGSVKLEEAVDCYQRAANIFKIARKWDQAGNAFCEAGYLLSKSGNRHDAATNFVDAANCYKKSEPDRAIQSLLRAIEIYIDMGRFTMAAKHHQSIAELYETEHLDLDRALSHYEQAADYFIGEESNSSANICLLKVAQFAAELEDYDKAIKIYEQVAATSLNISLLKYSAKEYFFRAALCHLRVDILNAKHALEHYQNMYPGFQDSRECKLVKVSEETEKIYMSQSSSDSTYESEADRQEKVTPSLPSLSYKDTGVSEDNYTPVEKLLSEDLQLSDSGSDD